MEIRKMAGLCLILFGVINVLQAIHIYGRYGRGISTTQAFVTSLLFTAGAAFLWLNKKRITRS